MIGNPPYGVSIKDHYRIKVLKTLGKVPDFEIYYYFIEVAKIFLKENGIKSYIIPNTFLFNVFASDYRKKLLIEWNVKIIDCTAFKIFEGATVYNAITIFSKTTSSKFIEYKITQSADNFQQLIKNENKKLSTDNILKNNQNWSLVFKLDQNILNLIQKIKSTGELLSSHYDVTQGYIPYRKSDLIKKYGKVRGEEIVKNREWHSSYKINDEYKEEIWGQSINKFSYKNTGSYIWYGKHLATYIDLKFFNQKRLLVREITNPTIIACIVNEEFVNDPQIINILEKSEFISIEFLWSILNSRLGTFYHFNSSPKATKGAFPKILVYDINNFPLPSFINNNYIKKKLTNKANLLLQVQKKSLSTLELENEIDTIIYKNYDLTYDEVLIIDPDFKLVKEEYDKFIFQ